MFRLFAKKYTVEVKRILANIKLNNNKNKNKGKINLK